MSAANYTPIDLAEVRSQQVAELSALLDAKRTSLYAARFAHRAGRPSKTHLLGQMRRDVARLTLVLSQKVKSERGAASMQGRTAAESNNG